jgi:uncharacterized OsmC-like protein
MEKRSISISLTGKDKFQIKADISGVTYYVDKKSQGYDPAGPDPLEMFLSSLGACIGVFAKRYLDSRSTVFKKLEIKVDAEFTMESPMRLINIKVNVSTDAVVSAADKELFMRFINACPVHNTILNTKNISMALETK